MSHFGRETLHSVRSFLVSLRPETKDEFMIINPTNRDDIRERAIETTSEIVLKCGNLSVRMDDVEEDVLTVFIKHLEVLIAESRERDHNKFEDMDKYPKLKKLFHEHLADMACRMRGFMELGVRQGVFRDDLNMDVLMKSFSAMGTMANKESESGQFRYDELIDGTIVVLLRGIATPKGMEKLDKYRYKSNNR